MAEAETQPVSAGCSAADATVRIETAGAPPPASRPEAEVGPCPTVPDHEIICPVAHGAYGEVWLARNAMGTYRAVKVVRREHFATQRPFDREFAGTKHFEPLSRSHEALTDILQVGLSSDSFYYVMELADDLATGSEIRPETYQAHTLRAELERRERLPVRQCLQVMLPLLDGLAFIHRHGLVHRDIKPSNIIFIGGHPKLADIGLVAEQSDAVSWVGTAGYIPPEGPGSERADVYSAGKVLYEMLTGNDRCDFPDMPESLGPDCNEHCRAEFEAVLSRACAPDVRQRYRSAEAFRSDLLLLQEGESVLAARARQRRLRLRLASLVLISLLVAIAWILWSKIPRAPGFQPAVRIAIPPFETPSTNELDRAVARGLAVELMNRFRLLERTDPSLRVVVVEASPAPAGPDAPRKGFSAPGANRIALGTYTPAPTGAVVSLKLLDDSGRRTLSTLEVRTSRTNLLTLNDDLFQQFRVALGRSPVDRKTRASRATGTRSEPAFDRYLQGVGFLARHDNKEFLDRALFALQQALILDSRFGPAYAALGEACWQKYRQTEDRAWTAEAEQICRRALALAPDDPTSLVTLSRIQAGTLGQRTAITTLKQALAIDPRHSAAIVELAQAQNAIGDADGALRTLLDGIHRRPDDWALYNQLGKFHYNHGRYGEAAEAYRTVARLHPDSYLAPRNLGGIYILLGDLPRAIEASTQSLAIAESEEALSNLGTALYYLGDYAGSAQTYARAMRGDPSDHRHAGNFGDACRLLPGREKDVLSAYQVAAVAAREKLAVNPRDQETLAYLAFYSVQLGDRPAARRRIQEALAGSGASQPEVLFYACLVEEALGNRPAALDRLAQALDLGCPLFRVERTPDLAALRADAAYEAIRVRFADTLPTPTPAQ